MKRWFFIIFLFFICPFFVNYFPAHGAPPTPENPLILKEAQFIGPTHFLIHEKTGPFTYYRREIEKRTGGRVKIQLYHSQSLGKAKDHFDLARKGVADLSGIVQGYTPGFFPLTAVAQLPFPAPGTSFSVVAKALWELNKKGVLDKAYHSVKVLNLDPTDQYIIFTKKRISKLEDFKGLRIRSAGGEWPDILNAWGATPVSMSIADAYMGLQRGMIDAIATNWAAAPGWKIYEVAEYVLESYVGSSALAFIMNLDTWKNLPPDIQKVFDDFNEEFVGMATHGAEKLDVLGYELFGQKVGRREFMEKGIKVCELPPEETAKMRKAVIPLWEKWVKDTEAEGLPGKKVMEAYIAALRQYGAKPIYEPTWK